MKWIDQMERKFGKYAVRDLINYFLVIYIGSAVMGLFFPGFYTQYLMLDFGAVLHGQIWRLVTFIMEPESLNGFLNILFFIFSVSLYYLFGHSLENAWGAFRFNLFFFSGILLNILAAALYYAFSGSAYPAGLSYIYQSMFFAFALLNPDMQFMIYGIIPMKVKYLAFIDAVLLAVKLIQYLSLHAYGYALAMLVAMLNFFVYFAWYQNRSGYTVHQVRRKAAFKRAAMRPQGQSVHKCAICGRTSETNPELEFRYCSKCEGNYEYCQDHLFTHEHVKKKNGKEPT